MGLMSEGLSGTFLREARHFAELLDWPEVRKRCEAFRAGLRSVGACPWKGFGI